MLSGAADRQCVAFVGLVATPGRREALADHDITHNRTRPYRPQTNGNVERFNRILLATNYQDG